MHPADKIFLIIYAAIVVILLISESAHAGKWSMVVNGHAAHFGTMYNESMELKPVTRTRGAWSTTSLELVKVREVVNFNEVNAGLGLERELRGNWYTTAGNYTDSFYKRQYYAGIGQRWTRGTLLKGAIGWQGGGMTHSQYKSGRVPFPYILPVASVGVKKVHVQFTYIPAIAGNRVPFLWTQLKIDI